MQPFVVNNSKCVNKVCKFIDTKNSVSYISRAVLSLSGVTIT